MVTLPVGDTVAETAGVREGVREGEGVEEGVVRGVSDAPPLRLGTRDTLGFPEKVALPGVLEGEREGLWVTDCVPLLDTVPVFRALGETSPVGDTEGLPEAERRTVGVAREEAVVLPLMVGWEEEEEEGVGESVEVGQEVGVAAHPVCEAVKEAERVGWGVKEGEGEEERVGVEDTVEEAVGVGREEREGAPPEGVTVGEGEGEEAGEEDTLEDRVCVGEAEVEGVVKCREGLERAEAVEFTKAVGDTEGEGDTEAVGVWDRVRVEVGVGEAVPAVRGSSSPSVEVAFTVSVTVPVGEEVGQEVKEGVAVPFKEGVRAGVRVKVMVGVGVVEREEERDTEAEGVRVVPGVRVVAGEVVGGRGLPLTQVVEDTVEVGEGVVVGERVLMEEALGVRVAGAVGVSPRDCVGKNRGEEDTVRVPCKRGVEVTVMELDTVGVAKTAESVGEEVPEGV